MTKLLKLWPAASTHEEAPEQGPLLDCWAVEAHVTCPGDHLYQDHTQAMPPGPQSAFHEDGSQALLTQAMKDKQLAFTH
jgi:hypothetical protein